MTLPIINCKASNAPALFVMSLRETGFAVLENHPIKQKEVERIYTLWQDFFCGEEKHGYAFDEKSHAGFVSSQRSETAKGYSLKDLKEFFH